MTRAAPRRLYGFSDRGELGPGAVADVAVYKDQKDKAGMFRKAAYVLRTGSLSCATAPSPITHGKTLHVKPGFNRAIEKRLDAITTIFYGLPRSMFSVHDAALPNQDAFAEVACRS